MNEHVSITGFTPVTAPPALKTEADLLREVTVTRVNTVDAEQRLREATLKRDTTLADLDRKVAAARDELNTAYTAFRDAQRALVERVSLDPINPTPWPGIEAVKHEPVAEEIPDDDDYDAVLRAASGRM